MHGAAASKKRRSPTVMLMNATRKPFLNAAGNVDLVLKTRRFHQNVRTGIRSQLPPDISTKLENTGRDCENKLEQGQGRLHLLAHEGRHAGCNQGAHPRPCREYAAINAKSGAASHAGPHASGHPPSSAASASMPLLQPTAAPLSDVAPPVPPDHTALVAITPPVDSGMPFLDIFPAEWRSDPEWPKVIASLNAYMYSFAPYQGEAQRALLAANPQALLEGLATISVYSSLPAEELPRVAYERDIVNIQMEKPFGESINEKVLGCKASRMMESELAQKPGSQLSMSMKVPCLPESGDTRRPMILSVSAPALDTRNQPEWKHYVNEGRLDQNAYRTAFQTLVDHIEQCVAAPENKGAQLVLSGFGMTNFLSGLSDDEKGVARTNRRRCVRRPDQQAPCPGRRCRLYGCLGFLSSLACGQCRSWRPSADLRGQHSGRLDQGPANYRERRDPHALVGNGCARDRSLDGYVGRNSLVHELHALACMLYRYKFGIWAPPRV